MVIQNKGLYPAARGFTAVESPGNHGGVVHHQEVPGPEQIGQVGKVVMPQVRGSSLKVEEARMLALRNRALGNEPFRQLVVIVLASVH
jgi:hypothetical protein